MKTKLATIFAISITILLLWPPPQSSSQTQQPLKHFGYIGAVTDSDLDTVRSYTDFTYVDGEYGQSIVTLATRIKSRGMRAVIDLGRVLWCPQDPSNPFGAWHLCNSSETDYVTRWNQWVSMNSSVLNGNYVLAFSVITEPSLRSISTADVETAVALVKQTHPQIATLVAEAYISVNQTTFQVPRNADWIGIAGYQIHSNLDAAFKESVRVLKLKKQSWQRLAYTMDAYYGPSHTTIAPNIADMDTIAQEWYTIASRDPEAILLAPFLWANLPGENALGSVSFPQNVLAKHAAIGAAIFAGRAPTYQGTFERIDCQSIGGWAWDASQPNTPVSVDVYDGTQKIATVRANQFRQDLLNAGIGNGQHAFVLPLPASLRNGQTHSITIKHSGLDQPLSLSPRSISCATPVSYDGWVDVADCNSIIGWAADRNRPSTSIVVTIYDGSSFVTSVLASDLRSDVGAYLGDNGRHGFAIPTPTRFKDGLPHTLRVKFESSTTELYGSPKTLTCITYYELVARHSGKCLDVAGGSTATGAMLTQWTCVGVPNQHFRIVSVGGGYNKIVARHSGKVLDVQWGSLDNGAPVWQMDENGTPAQQWQLVNVGGGYYKILARHSGKALDVAGGFTTNGTQVHQWDYVAIANQQWQLRPVQ
jgi:Ricin-type beta-trefoil lectin domain-like